MSMESGLRRKLLGGDDKDAEGSQTKASDTPVPDEINVNVVGNVGCGDPSSESNIMPKELRETHAVISRALNTLTACPNFIADSSRPYCLPMLTDGVKHPDQRNISPHILAKVLSGEFSNVKARFVIIDCRYPYEFEGGHIAGAVNVYTKDQILSDILPNEPCLRLPFGDGSDLTAAVGVGDGTGSAQDRIPNKEDKPTILIFHCEFSSKRGPDLARFLRSRDRSLNGENFPALHFPEVYLLDGGYKAFYECYPAHCTPSAYRTMLDPNHTADLRHFKAQAKTWSGDRLAKTAGGAKCNRAQGPVPRKPF